ncbi:GMC family oxidoreductase [Rhodococcus sp. NPDC019627]|uniref:GMC family oxidoreductase n=1 Tax=unclassified Rhodococcus (in: high G+C Gram-positive bacteria) TaxID=192944 RepID=UPI00340A294F
MKTNTFDYVVVGGGTAGCIVAARLSEEPSVSVLLLEAGGDERRPEVQTPEMWPATLGSDLDWAFQTVPQQKLGRAVPVPRGRVLGGSGSINVMAHLRGHRLDYDDWAARGADGWSYEDVLPFHMKSEDVPSGDPSVRGRGGPLEPAAIADPHPLSLAHVEAARRAGYVIAAELNDGELRGAACHDLLISADHQRQSAASAYLRPAADRPNLTIVTRATVTGLLIIGGRCQGVNYVADDRSESVSANVETVLCAGAVGTTRLLLASGIGPADELTPLGVSPVVDSTEVGKNLQDHVLLAGVRVRVDKELPPPSGNFAEATLFTTLDGSPGRPDLQICNIQVDYHTSVQDPAGAAFTMGIGHMRPASRGTIRLASADPAAAPLIDPAYLTEKADVDALITGVEVVAKLADTGAFDEWGGRCDHTDLLKLDRRDLERAIADGVSSFFHLSGTCRMGSDDDAVVDPSLRVRGVEKLRVADASVMPSIVSCNTNAATVMIAEKAAALLLDRDCTVAAENVS